MTKPLFTFYFMVNPKLRAADTREKTAQMLRSFRRKDYEVKRMAAHDYEINVKGSPDLACRIYAEGAP